MHLSAEIKTTTHVSFITPLHMMHLVPVGKKEAAVLQAAAVWQLGQQLPQPGVGGSQQQAVCSHYHRPAQHHLNIKYGTR
jgi:hypothetical protein